MLSTGKKVLLVCLLFFTLPFAVSATDSPRIISWGRGSSLVLDMLYMFPEAEDSIIAMGNGGGFQKLLDENYDEKAVLEMEIQPEIVAAYNPTHIVLKSYMEKTAAILETLGISTLFIEMESPEQYDTGLDRIGDMFGDRDRAEELKKYFKDQRLEVIDITDPIPADEKPTVLFLYYNTKGGNTSLMIPPSDWIQTKMIEWAGGVPIWKNTFVGERWQNVSFEQIARWNPDTVFLVSYHGDIDEVKNNLTSDPLWNMLDACKNNKIFTVPSDYLSWDQPSPRWVLGLNWMGTKLHPELFTMERLNDKLYQFYKTTYGLSELDVDENILTIIEGDYR